MADGFTIDASEIKAFARRMRHMGDRKFATAIRGVHRKHSKILAKKIKVALPKTGGLTAGTAQAGGSVRSRIKTATKRSGWKKEGSAHKTKRGAMSQSVRTAVTTASSDVLGGGTAKAPHYAVNEFGGAVWWRPRAGGVRMHPVAAKRLHRSWASQRAKHGQKKGHIIPVRNRSKTFNGGVEGWFFYPASRREEPALIKAYDKELHDLIERNLPKFKLGGH